MDSRRGSRNSLPDSGIPIVEEVVEYAPRARAGTDADKAYEFGRIDPEVSCLLGYDYIAADDGSVVDLVIVGFPLELDVRRGGSLLAPEPVERGETGVLEAGDVDPLVELKSCRKRLSDNGFAAAEIESHEQVSGGNVACRRDGPRAAGCAAGVGAGASLCAVGYDLYRRCPGGYLFPSYRRAGGRDSECPGCGGL